MYDPITGLYRYEPAPAPQPAPLRALLPPGPGNSGQDQAPAYGTVTPGNPGTTQSLGQMARESWGLAQDILPTGSMPWNAGWGELAGSLVGNIIGGPMVGGVIGVMGDRVHGISEGARNQDPTAARIGSGIPSQMTGGALAQAAANEKLGNTMPSMSLWGGLFGPDPVADPIDKSQVDVNYGAGYDAAGNYGGSMDKGAPGSGQGSASHTSGVADPDVQKRRGGRIGALKRYREAR